MRLDERDSVGMLDYHIEPLDSAVTMNPYQDQDQQQQQQVVSEADPFESNIDDVDTNFVYSSSSSSSRSSRNSRNSSSRSSQ